MTKIRAEIKRGHEVLEQNLEQKLEQKLKDLKQELTQELEPGKEVECLTNRLQQHFREQSASSAAIPKDARKQMLEQHVRACRTPAAPASPHLRRR